MIESIRQLYAILDTRTRLQFVFLLIPMIVITGLEVFSIGLILFLISLTVNITASAVLFRARKRTERLLS